MYGLIPHNWCSTIATGGEDTTALQHYSKHLYNLYVIYVTVRMET